MPLHNRRVLWRDQSFCTRERHERTIYCCPLRVKAIESCNMWRSNWEPSTQDESFKFLHCLQPRSRLLDHHHLLHKHALCTYEMPWTVTLQSVLCATDIGNSAYTLLSTKTSHGRHQAHEMSSNSVIASYSRNQAWLTYHSEESRGALPMCTRAVSFTGMCDDISYVRFVMCTSLALWSLIIIVPRASCLALS